MAVADLVVDDEDNKILATTKHKMQIGCKDASMTIWVRRLFIINGVMIWCPWLLILVPKAPQP